LSFTFWPGEILNDANALLTSGYAFLLFKEEMSVQNLIDCCLREGDKLYLRVSSPTIRNKPVSILQIILLLKTICYPLSTKV